MIREAFDGAFLRRLERLEIAARRAFAGRIRGERRSPKRGQSVEFADYREYTAGDDFRYIDWNAFARFESLFLKLYVEEEDRIVHVLLDASASMGTGEPDKWVFARRLAAAFAYLSLARFDRVRIVRLQGGEAIAGPLLRGKGKLPAILDALESVPASGETDLARGIERFCLENRRPGMALLLSDFLDPSSEEGLKRLGAERLDPFAVQVLSPQEIDPDLAGDLRLVDAETDRAVEVSVNPRLLKRYRERLDRFCEGIRQACRRCGVAYTRTSTSVPFEELMLKRLRTIGWVK